MSIHFLLAWLLGCAVVLTGCGLVLLVRRYEAFNRRTFRSY